MGKITREEFEKLVYRLQAAFVQVPYMDLVRHDAEKILCEEFNLFEIAEDSAKLTAPGWDIPDDAYLNDRGYIQWFDGDTHWLVDPETGESCHKGNGKGCFWTDWE